METLQDCVYYTLITHLSFSQALQLLHSFPLDTRLKDGSKSHVTDRIIISSTKVIDLFIYLLLLFFYPFVPQLCSGSLLNDLHVLSSLISKTPGKSTINDGDAFKAESTIIIVNIYVLVSFRHLKFVVSTARLFAGIYNVPYSEKVKYMI